MATLPTTPNNKTRQLFGNIGRIFLWFFGMIGLLLIAIVITAFIPEHKKAVYFSVFVLFIFLRVFFVRWMRVRVQYQNFMQQKQKENK